MTPQLSEELYSAYRYTRVTSYPYPITTHDSICRPRLRPQRCARAVINVMSGLICDKLVVAAFFSPAMFLLLSLLCAKLSWPRVCRVFRCCGFAEDTPYYQQDAETRWPCVR